MEAKVSSKGQVTIPQPLRERFGIKAVTILDFREDAGRIILTKTTMDDPVSAVYGSLSDGRKTEQIMAEIQGTE